MYACTLVNFIFAYEVHSKTCFVLYSCITPYQIVITKSFNPTSYTYKIDHQTTWTPMLRRETLPGQQMNCLPHRRPRNKSSGPSRLQCINGDTALDFSQKAEIQAHDFHFFCLTWHGGVKWGKPLGSSNTSPRLVFFSP